MLVRWNQSLRHAQFKKNLGSGGECKCVHKWGEIVVSKVIPFRPFGLDYLMDTSCVPKWPETPPGKCATINLFGQKRQSFFFWGGGSTCLKCSNICSLSLSLSPSPSGPEKSHLFSGESKIERNCWRWCRPIYRESDANDFASFSCPQKMFEKCRNWMPFFEREMELRALMVLGLPLFLCIHQK